MVSCVVTAYNVSAYIERCIASILDSVNVELELVVVEDKSTDNTLSIIESFTDSRIKLIKNKENLGAGMSRRIGIENSSGDYIITIDGDDYISPEFLGNLYTKALETSADIVSGGVSVVHENGSFEIVGYGDKVETGVQKMQCLNRKVAFLNNKIVKASLYKHYSYSSRRYIEDTQTLAALLYLAKEVVYINSCGYYYVQRNTSLCHVADPFKHALFCSLCAYDAWRWFEDKEEEYQNIFGRDLFWREASRVFALCPSRKDMARFPSEWEEFMDAVDKYKLLI